MAKVKRQIIKIDEDKCNGCGACVPACKEGALQIIDGKARLVSEIYCDGLGACLGDCPTGALTIEEREAEEFTIDSKASKASKEKMACGCPGTMARAIERKAKAAPAADDQQSELGQWPIQLALIPAMAPYLKNSDLVLLADCTAVAYANLHRDFVKDKVIAMACPKLDDSEMYIDKLVEMMKLNDFKSIEVVIMEVPCCGGLKNIIEQARSLAGVDVDIKQTIVSVEGKVLK